MNSNIDFSIKRKQHRDTRNNLRKLFLFLVTISFLILLSSIFFFSPQLNVNIEIHNASLVKSELILAFVKQRVINKNFYLLSPRKISESLIKDFPVLKLVIARKYLLPKNKIIILLKEKLIWSKYSFSTSRSFNYVTDEGDLINLSQLNVEKIDKTLPLIYHSGNAVLTKGEIALLKKVFDFFNNDLKLKIVRFVIYGNRSLEVNTAIGLNIKAGSLDTFVLRKILKLRDILRLIKEKSYLIQYIDLSLENAAVMKKLENDNMD